MRFRNNLTILLVCLSVAIIGFAGKASAQMITYDNVPPLNGGGNTAGGISFNLTTNTPIIIDSIRGAFSTATGTCNLWYNPTSKVNGPPVVSTTNGWINLGTATFAGISPATSNIIVQTIPIGVNVAMNPADTFGFFIQWTGNVYPTTTVTVPTAYTNGTVSILSGANAGYAGTGTSPTYTPRTINGGVIYHRSIRPFNNASVASLATPAAGFCAGTQSVSVKIRNTGFNKLNNVKINWRVDGVAQPQINWTTPIDTIGSSGGNEATVVLGNVTFATAPRVIKVWTELPNGVVDTVKNDDTIQVTRASSISGTFTVGGTSPNYANLTAAITDLATRGVCGPVILNVANGTYNEQGAIPPIMGASAVNRITIQSATGNAANVTIQTSSTATTNNYVLKLDGASYFTFKNLTFKNNGTTYARCIDVAGAASYDSIVNCKLTGAATTTSSNNTAKFFSDELTGTGNVLQGCTTENGSYGIFVSGTGTTNLVDGWTVQNNTVTNAYNYSMYLYYTSNLKVRNNTITTTSTTTHYGIYGYYNDNALEVTGNKVTATAAGAKYGIYLYYSDGTATDRGLVANNVVLVGNGTGTARGLQAYYSSYQRYYNNTVNILSTSATAGYAAYFYFSSATTYTNNEIRNNVFANTGGGYAMYVYNPALADNNTWDYNNLYTTGAKLVDQGTPATDYADLTAWRAASKKDMNSIFYNPGFINPSGNLAPDPANPAAWSVNGRGVHLAGNNKDINGNTRSVTLTGGVPDLGAYEFTPTTTPPAATAVPATPVQGGTQYFTFGQDTVASIKWSATGVLPTTLAVRQYSGTLPPQLLTTSPNSYMYFYTHIDMPTTTYDFDPNIYYKKPWLGAVTNENNIKMIRKLGSSAWLPYNGAGSTNNVTRSIITAPGVANPGYFTGILDDVLFFAFIYPGKRAFCPGGNVLLEANTGNNITYKWKLNGNYIPGATSANYAATAAGQYEVEETRNSVVVNSDFVVVNMVSPPASVITTSGNPVICVGGDIQLNANTGSGLTYQWKLNNNDIPLAVGTTYNANAVGTYTLEVTNPGCSTVSAPVIVTSQPMPMATINPSTDIPLCPGVAATLQMTVPPTGINNVTAQWRVDGIDIPGATGAVFNATMVGNYTVVLSSGNCPTTVSPGTNLLPAQVPFPVITMEKQNLLVQSTFASYQWFRDGVLIPKATKFYYTPTQSGVYTVEVSNGGCTGLSADFTFIPMGVDDNGSAGQQVKIYPNPATSVVNIDAPAAVNVTLTSIEGRVVMDMKQVKQIDISALPKGAYIIKVMDGNGVLLSTQKLLKTSE